MEELWTKAFQPASPPKLRGNPHQPVQDMLQTIDALRNIGMRADEVSLYIKQLVPFQNGMIIQNFKA